MHSTSTKRVCNSSSFKDANPITFFKQFLTDLTKHSHIPPHQGVLSLEKCHVIPLFAKYVCTLFDQIIFMISLEALLNVLALSLNTIEGRPLLAAKRLNALKKVSTSSNLSTISRCTALVEEHVNKGTFEQYPIWPFIWCLYFPVDNICKVLLIL